MATNQPANSQNRNPQTPKKEPNSLMKALGPRETVAEDLGDISTALGAVLLLSSGVNFILVLVALAISVKYPEFAPAILGATIFDLPTLFKYFLSTFPLLFGISVLTILIFSKVLQNIFAIAITMAIAFSLGIWLGGALGISDFSFNDVNTSGISAGMFTIPIAFIVAFYMKYGAYRFFTSTLTGVVIAWSVSIKMLHHLKK